MSSHRKAIPIATNKASGLPARKTNNITKASKLLAGAERDRYEAWFFLYLDWMDKGGGARPYAQMLSVNPNITTKLPPVQAEHILSAIRRCVKKYGTIAAVKREHAEWAEKQGYHYVDASNLKEFAPEGQREKNVEKPVVKPATAVTLTRAEASKRLSAFPKGMRDDIIKALGIK